MSFFFFFLKKYTLKYLKIKEHCVSTLLGNIEGKRRRRWLRMRWLDSITDSKDMNLSKLQEVVKDSRAGCAADCGVARVGHDLVSEQ